MNVHRNFGAMATEEESATGPSEPAPCAGADSGAGIEVEAKQKELRKPDVAEKVEDPQGQDSGKTEGETQEGAVTAVAAPKAHAEGGLGLEELRPPTGEPKAMAPGDTLKEATSQTTTGTAPGGANGAPTPPNASVGAPPRPPGVPVGTRLGKVLARAKSKVKMGIQRARDKEKLQKDCGGLCF
eukprot:g3180.t2